MCRACEDGCCMLDCFCGSCIGDENACMHRLDGAAWLIAVLRVLTDCSAAILRTDGCTRLSCSGRDRHEWLKGVAPRACIVHGQLLAHILAFSVSAVQVRDVASHALVQYGNATNRRAVLRVLLCHVLCEHCRCSRPTLL